MKHIQVEDDIVRAIAFVQAEFLSSLGVFKCLERMVNVGQG